ncbi:MAG: hypothetical protein GDA66_19060 [Nitrospira sp. CR1.2]|nr:hypothetical protein [Nitrospira sp. CR1.2]
MFNLINQGCGRRRSAAAPGPLITAFVLLCATTRAVPQDALRYSLTGQEMARSRAQALQNEDYNLKLGNAKFRAGASLSTEFNDNVNLSDSSSADSDVILRPQLNTSLHWPITAKNALNFSLGLGYVKYVQSSQDDYLMLTPGSELSFDIFVGDFRFTLYDRFSYSQDPLQNSAVSGVARYGGLDNAAGVNVLWDLNKIILSTGYAHVNFIPDQADFDYLARSSENVFLRAAYLINSTTVVGVESSSGLTTYDNPTFLNNALSFSVGPFTEIKVTDHLDLDARAGFVGYNFETEDSSVIGVAENPRSYYFDVGLRHTLNQ